MLSACLQQLLYAVGLPYLSCPARTNQVWPIIGMALIEACVKIGLHGLNDLSIGSFLASKDSNI